MPRRRESAISQGKRGSDVENEEVTVQKKQRTAEDSNSPNQSSVESPIVIEDVEEHSIVTEENHGQTPTKEGNTVVVLEGEGQPVYETAKGQGHTIYEQPRRETSASGRNLSLEALFQVTDTELQAMTKQTPHLIIPPDIQSETVVESSQSEPSGEASSNLIGEPDVYRQEGVVKIQGHEDGGEKYEFRSHALEQQGLKFIYTKPADAIGREAVTIASLVPYQTESIANGKVVQIADGNITQVQTTNDTIIYQSVGSKRKREPVHTVEQPAEMDQEKTAQTVEKLANKAGGTVEGHIRVKKQSSKPGKHICPYCHRGCAKPSVLEKHIRAHTGERPYPCETCGFSFKTKSNLYKHCKSRAHTLKVGIETKKRKITFGSLDDVNVNEVEISTEAEDVDISDSETESGEEREDEEKLGIARQEQAPTHVLKQVAEFLGKTKDERPKIETEKFMKEAKQKKAVQKKVVQRASTVKGNISSSVTPDKKQVVRSFSVPSHFAQLHDHQGLSRFVPVSSNNTHQEKQKYTSSDIITAPIVQETQPGQLILPTQFLPTSLNFKIQIPRLNPTNTSSKEIKTTKTVESISSSKDIKSIESLESSYNQIEMVTLPHPEADEETTNKALRDLEALSEKFKNALKDGVRLQKSIEKLPDKRVRVIIKVQEPADKSPDAAPQLSGIVRSNSVSQPEKQTPSIKGLTAAELKERISQLISANEAIVESPKLEPLRPKFVKRTLSRQDSEIKESSKAAAFQKSSAGMKLKRQDASESEKENTDAVKNYGENVIVERIESDGESIIILSNKDDIDDDQIEIEEQPVQLVSDETINLEIQKKIRDTDKIKETHSEKIQMSSMKQNPLSRYFEIIKPPADNQNKSEPSQAQNMSTSNSLTKKGIVYQPSVEKVFGSQSENVILTAVSAPVLPVAQQVVLQTQQQPPTPTILTLPPSKLILSSQSDTLIKYPVFNKSVTVTSPLSASTESLPARVPGQVGKMALKNMKLRSKSLSSSVPSSKSMPKPEVSVPSSLHIANIPQTPTTGIQTPTTPLTPHNQSLSILGQMQQGNIQHFLVRTDSVPLLMANPQLLQKEQSVIQSTAAVPTTSTGTVMQNIFSPGVSSITGTPILTNTTKPATRPTSLSTSSNKPLISFDPLLLKSKFTSTQMNLNSPAATPVATIDPETNEIKIQINLHPVSNVFTPVTDTQGSNTKSASKAEHRGHTPSWAEPSPAVTSPFSTSASVATVQSKLSPPTYRFQSSPVSRVITPTRPRNTPVFRFGSQTLSSPTVIQSPQHMPVFRFQTAQKTKSGTETVTQITDPQILHKLLTSGKLKISSDETASTTLNTERSDASPAVDQELRTAESFEKAAETQQQSKLIYGPHKCNFCGIAFRKEGTLNLHLLYYCKVRHKRSSRPHRSPSVDREIIAELFAQPSARLRLKQEEKDSTLTETITSQSDANLVFENFEPSVWPKRKSKVKIVTTSEEEIKPGRAVPVITTPSTYRRWFPPLRRSKSEVVENKSSSEVGTQKTRPAWEQKLKGQILRRKLKGKLLMKRSLSFDASTFKETPESKPKVSKTVVETKSDTPEKSKDVPISKKFGASVANETTTYRLRRPPLRRSESVPAIKRSSTKTGESDVKEEQNTSQEVVPVSPTESPEKSVVNWHLSDISVPVMYAPCLNLSGTIPKPIYQQNSRMRFFDGMGTPQSLVPSAILTPRPDLTVDKIKKKFTFENSSERHQPDNNTSQEIPDAEKVSKTSDIQTPRTPLSAKSPNSLLSLTLLGHSYPTLRNLTHITFCCLNRLQPMYVCGGRNKKVSMYSNWCIAKHNPNPYGLSAKTLLSLYNSRYTSNPVWAINSGSNSNSGVITHSSYWQFKEDQKSCSDSVKKEEGKLDSYEDVKPDKNSLPSKVEVKITETKGKVIKIFQGGYKSLEPYTYVRGRGRGKYVCEECGIRCKKPSMLKKHIRTHTDLRPYSCNHCKFSFKTKGNLTKHMKSKAHQKKCIEIGIVPVPLYIDDSQIDYTALEAQCSLSKHTQISPGGSHHPQESFEDDDDDDNDDNGADEEDDTEENETEVMEVDDKSSEPEVEIIKDEVSSSKSEPSSSLDDKRKYFLEALGVIAKQPDPREMVRQTSQEGMASQLNIGSSLQSVAVSSVAVSATVASDLSTVYDLEKLHSSQNEDNEGRIRKDQEIIWSLLNLSDERKQSPKEKEKQSTAVEGTVEQTQEDKVQENDKTNETPASEVASSQVQSTASQNNIPVKIPLGGFGPPLIHVIKDSKLASSDTQEQHLARGPIVGQMIRQDSNPGSNSDNVEKASSESVFIPFQFQHPFPTSEDLATSPVKLVVSPDKKGSLSEIISLVISSKAEGNVDSSQTVSSKVSNVLIPVSVQKGIQPKTVHLSADGCKMSEVQAEIINVDPETFEINAKACKNVSEEENSKTPSKSIDNDEVFIIDSKEGKDNQTLVVKNMGEVEDSSIQSGSASSNVLTMSAVGNWHQAENLSILSEGLSKDSSGKTTKPRSIVIRQSTGGPNIIIQFDENVSSKVQDTRPAQSYKAEQSKGRFVCNICQSSFPEQQQLTLHMNIHVLKSKLKCRKCNMTFRSTHSYEKHIAYDIHIGDENTDELVATVDNPRPFKCEPCDIAFRLKGHLTKHFRSKTHFSQLESQGILNPGTYEKVEAKLVDLEATSLDNFLNEMKSMCNSVDGSADRLSKSVDNTQLGPKIKPRTDYIVIEAPNKAQQGETNQEVVDSNSGSNFLEGLKKYSKSQFEIDKEASNRNVTVEIKQSMIEIGSAEGESDVGNNGMGNSEKETDLVGNLVCEESKSSAVCTYDTKTEDVKEEKEFIAVPYKPTSSGDFDGMGVSVSDGPNICGLCRQGFKTMLLLKTHLITHAELRPYVCEYCDAGFTNGQSLRIHLLTHTQERPYICGLCGDTFANTDHLLDHTKSQHTSLSNVPYTSSSSEEVHTVVSSSHIFSSSELNSSTSICGTVLSVQPLSGSGSSVGNQISGPDLPSNTGVVKMEPSHHKVRIRHLKRQERVGSPDQQEVTALRVEKINVHEQAESLSTSGERVTSPVGERVASPDQENIVHTTDDTVTKNVQYDHIIKTEIAESNTFENVSSLVISKQEDISHTVDITPDQSIQDCSPLAQDVSENNLVSEETCNSLSVQSIDEFVQSPLGVVNISEISCSDNTGNPVIVVVGNPIQESSSNADNEKLFSEAQLSEKTLEIDTSLIDDSNNESRTDSDKIAQLIPVEIPVEHTSSVKDEVDQRVNLNIVDNGNMLEILPLEVSAEHEKLQITQTDQIKEESPVHSVCSLADSAENRDISNADIIESGQHTEENQDPRVNVSEITSLEQVIVSDSSVMFTATCLSSDIKNVSDINNAEVYEQNSQTALEQEDVDMATDEVSEQTMKDDESTSGN